MNKSQELNTRRDEFRALLESFVDLGMVAERERCAKIARTAAEIALTEVGKCIALEIAKRIEETTNDPE